MTSSAFNRNVGPERELLQALRSDPKDPALRSVLADHWLEQSEPHVRARGESMVIADQLADLDRARTEGSLDDVGRATAVALRRRAFELHREYAERWLAEDLPPAWRALWTGPFRALRAEFDGGLLAGFVVDPHTPVGCLAEPMIAGLRTARTPIRRLHIKCVTRRDVDLVLSTPELGNLDALTVVVAHRHAAQFAFRMGRGSALGQIPKLEIHWRPVAGPDPVMFSGSEEFSGVRDFSLYLHAGLDEPQTLEALVASPMAERLHSLTFATARDWDELGIRGITAVASKRLANLRKLVLRTRSMSALPRRLLQTGALPNLTHLGIVLNGRGEDSEAVARWTAELARARALVGIEAIDSSFEHLVEVIRACPRWETLGLNNIVGLIDLRVLAEDPRWNQVRRLELRGVQGRNYLPREPPDARFGALLGDVPPSSIAELVLPEHEVRALDPRRETPWAPAVFGTACRQSPSA